MIALSRRQLARYAVEELVSGRPPADLADRLAAALVVSKKQKEADLLINDIFQELEGRHLLVLARLTSAHKLSENLKKSLSEKIKRMAKTENILISEEIDKDVIGGIKIETAVHTWDKTIARRLADIRGGI